MACAFSQSNFFFIADKTQGILSRKKEETTGSFTLIIPTINIIKLATNENVLVGLLEHTKAEDPLLIEAQIEKDGTYLYKTFKEKMTIETSDLTIDSKYMYVSINRTFIYAIRHSIPPKIQDIISYIPLKGTQFGIFHNDLPSLTEENDHLNNMVLTYEKGLSIMSPLMFTSSFLQCRQVNEDDEKIANITVEGYLQNCNEKKQSSDPNFQNFCIIKRSFVLDQNSKIKEHHQRLIKALFVIGILALVGFIIVRLVLYCRKRHARKKEENVRIPRNDDMGYGYEQPQSIQP